MASAEILAPRELIGSDDLADYFLVIEIREDGYTGSYVVREPKVVAAAPTTDSDESEFPACIDHSMPKSGPNFTIDSSPVALADSGIGEPHTKSSDLVADPDSSAVTAPGLPTTKKVRFQFMAIVDSRVKGLESEKDGFSYTSTGVSQRPIPKPPDYLSQLIALLRGTAVIPQPINEYTGLRFNFKELGAREIYCHDKPLMALRMKIPTYWSMDDESLRLIYWMEKYVYDALQRHIPTFLLCVFEEVVVSSNMQGHGFHINCYNFQIKGLLIVHLLPVMFGLVLRYKCVLFYRFSMAMISVVSFYIAAIYVIDVAAMEMLITIASGLDIEFSSPRSDNIGVLAELAGMSNKIHARTYALEVSRNTTIAIPQGGAICVNDDDIVVDGYLSVFVWKPPWMVVGNLVTCYIGRVNYIIAWNSLPLKLEKFTVAKMSVAAHIIDFVEEFVLDSRWLLVLQGVSHECAILFMKFCLRNALFWMLVQWHVSHFEDFIWHSLIYKCWIFFRHAKTINGCHVSQSTALFITIWIFVHGPPLSEGFVKSPDRPPDELILRVVAGFL